MQFFAYKITLAPIAGGDEPSFIVQISLAQAELLRQLSNTVDSIACDGRAISVHFGAVNADSIESAVEQAHAENWVKAE